MSLNVENLNRLIAHLEAQPPERINMGMVYIESGHTCGTAGCIVGHGKLIWPDNESCWAEGLYGDNYRNLIMPDGWEDDKYGSQRYPAHRVIATLKRLRDHYLATGEIVVDWGPEPSSGEPWAAPQAVDLTEPALPTEITRLLSLAPATETSGA